MRTVCLLITVTVTLLAGSAAIASIAQEQDTSQRNTAPSSAIANADQDKVFVFVQRTDRHAKYSSPEVFHDVLNDLLNYLKTKNVAIAIDEFGGRNHAEGATPLNTIFMIAHDSKASSVLYVVVDRPLTKWLKITVVCFDMNRKMLWQEEVSSGGGLSGAHGFQMCTTKIHAQLDKHVGQPGLPIATSSDFPAEKKQ